MRKSIILSLLVCFSFSAGFAQLSKLDLGLDNSTMKRNTEHEAFIDLLKDGEHYTINLMSMGCFGGSESSMKITKTNGAYYVEYEEAKIQLTKSDLDDFRGFEQELVNISKGNCTSTDTYTLTYNDKTYTHKDSTCSWNGFFRLKNKFNKQLPKG